MGDDLCTKEHFCLLGGGNLVTPPPPPPGACLGLGLVTRLGGRGAWNKAEIMNGMRFLGRYYGDESFALHVF